MEEKIFINDRKNKKIAAIYNCKDSKSEKIVIISHDFKSCKDSRPIYADAARKLREISIDSIRYDYTGNGESDGKHEKQSIYTYLENIEDVVGYVKSIGYKKISLIGLSMGSTISTLIDDENIEQIVLLSFVPASIDLYYRYEDNFKSGKRVIKPTTDGYKLIESGKKTKKELESEPVDGKYNVILGEDMWRSFKMVDIKEYINNHKSKTKTLVLLAGGDEVVKSDLKDIEKLFEDSNYEATVIEIYGADHGFERIGPRKDALELITKFMK